MNSGIKNEAEEKTENPFWLKWIGERFENFLLTVKSS
jgi:hypothetical protein